MKSSRRSFLRLLAAGSAATAATPAAALARAARKPKPAPASRPAAPPAGPALPPAVAGEIRRQQAMLEQTLQAVRRHPLPPGSEPAFVFAPLRSRRKADAP